MFKKSFIIVIIQIFGTVLGLLSLYLIAGSMDPEVYSLVGIYNVIAGITLTFSDLGLETTMMRETLYWKEHDDKDKVCEYATQAIFSRIIGFVILLPFLLIYLVYINHTKYEDSNMLLLCVFLIGAEVNSLNNAMSLMVRAQGGYVFAQAASTINNYLLKFAGIGLYFSLGDRAYLYFYGISSIPLAIVYLVKQRNIIKLVYIKFKPTLKKIWQSKYLWLKTDFEYFKNNADSLLVSTLLPAHIIGAYSIYKQFEQLSKNFIEGFFDVLSQQSVKFKGDKDKLQQYEHKFKEARNVTIIFILIAIIVFVENKSYFIELAHLTKYQNIDIMIICVAIVSIVHLLGKYEINALAFFASSKMNFVLGIVSCIISIISFAIFLFFPTVKGMLIQRVVIYSFVSFVSIVIFKRNRDTLYTSILR